MSLAFNNVDWRERRSDIASVPNPPPLASFDAAPRRAGALGESTDESTQADQITHNRTELMATALGLNISLAAMFTIVASAFGWLDARLIWGGWLILASLLSIVTTRRLCRALMPLFWIKSVTPIATRTFQQIERPERPFTQSDSRSSPLPSVNRRLA